MNQKIELCGGGPIDGRHINIDKNAKKYYYNDGHGKIHIYHYIDRENQMNNKLFSYKGYNI